MKTLTKSSGISFRNNRKTRIFLFFLFLTSIIWFIVALSKPYTSSTKVSVVYTNLPSSKLLLNQPVKEIDILLNATGFNLIKYKINQPKIQLSLLNCKNNGTHYYLLPNNQIGQIKQKLNGSTTILKFLNDTIFVNLGNNIAKKVPVNAKLKVNFKIGYNFIKQLKISPDSVLISGPKNSLDSIQEIVTNNLELSEVYENIQEQLQLKKPKNKNIKMAAYYVTATGEVDKFTEGKLKVPVQIINTPSQVKVIPFPKEIEVVYQAGITNFNKITSNSFSIVFDYEQYKNDTLVRYLSPLIAYKSELISTLKINPSQIEFLIQQ